MIKSKPCSCGETRFNLTHGICPKCSKREYRKEPCSHEGCHRKRTRRNLCNVHVKELVAQGLITLKDQSAKTCTIEGCSRSHHGGGLCLMHYKRKRNRMNPNFDESKSRIFEKSEVLIDTKIRSHKDGIEYSIPVLVLCDNSGIPRNAIVPALNALKDQSIIISFIIEDQIAVILVSRRYETLFNSNLNQKHPGLE